MRSSSSRKAAVPGTELDQLKLTMAQSIIVDLRNIYRPEEMKAAGSSIRASDGRSRDRKPAGELARSHTDAFRMRRHVATESSARTTGI
jgi:hypothetical protein